MLITTRSTHYFRTKIGLTVYSSTHEQPCLPAKKVPLISLLSGTAAIFQLMPIYIRLYVHMSGIWPFHSLSIQLECHKTGNWESLQHKHYWRSIPRVSCLCHQEICVFCRRTRTVRSYHGHWRFHIWPPCGGDARSNENSKDTQFN